jgi:hypothetical protein
VLADDTLGCHRKAVLIPDTVDDEGHLEGRGLLGRLRIESEWLYGKGLARLDNSRRLGNHAAHVLKRFDQIGLATGIGTVDGSTAQHAGSSLKPRAHRVRVLQRLVLRGDKAEHLLFTQGAKILHSKLNKHHPPPYHTNKSLFCIDSAKTQVILYRKQKSPDPTAGKGSEIGGSSFQVVVLGRTGQRAGPRHLSKLRAPV